MEAKKISRWPSAEPKGAAHAAGQEEQAGAPLVDPGGRHRAVELLQRLGAVVGRLGEGKDRLGVDGHLGLARRQPCRSKSSSSLTMIPLWIPTTGP